LASCQPIVPVSLLHIPASPGQCRFASDSSVQRWLDRGAERSSHGQWGGVGAVISSVPPRSWRVVVRADVGLPDLPANKIEQDRSYALRQAEQVNELYAKAVEQLGNEHAQVRLGQRPRYHLRCGWSSRGPRLDLFLAARAGAAPMLGHHWNLIPPTAVYEHLGSG
jgi:hypothetical protein